MATENEIKILKEYCIGRGVNIGCGPRPIENAINIDILADSKADVIANAAHLPLPSNRFDFVVSSHCLEHVNQAPLLVLREWFRVLKVGGVLAFLVPNGNDGISALGESPGTYVEGKHIHSFSDVPLHSLIDYAGGTKTKTIVLDRNEWKTTVILAVSYKHKDSKEYKPNSMMAYLMWLKAVRKTATISGLTKWIVEGW